MFAAIRRYNAFNGAMSAIADRVNQEFVPKLRQLPGFVTYYCLDAGDGSMITVSVFEDKTQAEESNRVGTTWARERLHNLVRTAPVITTGEVVAHGEAVAAG